MKLVLLLTLSLFVSTVYAEPVEKKAPQITAQFGDGPTTSGSRQLYVYSKVELSSPQYRLADVPTWDTLVPVESKDGYFVYKTSAYQDTSEGKVFRVRSLRKDALIQVDRLVVIAGNGKPGLEVSFEAEGKGEIVLAPVTPAPSVIPQRTANVALDQATVYHGSASIDPQTLAQARANELARIGQLQHLGGGFVNTTMGQLSEGCGMSSGGGTPDTCVARNGTAAVADAVASGPKGTFRVRLYNSPSGTMFPGGYGGSSSFRRR